MRKSEIDDLLSMMLDSHDNVSDLNVTVDRPLQVETSGELVGVPVDPTIDCLTSGASRSSSGSSRRRFPASRS